MLLVVLPQVRISHSCPHTRTQTQLYLSQDINLHAIEILRQTILVLH